MGMNTSDVRPVVKCGASRTKQSFRKQTDINGLVEKYKRTGTFADVNRRQPFYGDVSNMRSYRESLDVVIQAKETFERLPVAVRKRFDYDPGKMVAFFEDPANLPEAIAKGWAVKRPEDAHAGGSTPSGVSEPSGGAPKAS